MFQEFQENDKSEDFLNDFRNKINQQSMSSFQEKKEEINRSKNILIGAVSGVILAGIVGFIALSPKYNNNQDQELPVVRRPQNAIKVQPIEPGGMQIANQDKSIYDIIEKKVEDTSKSVESILPPPEQPKMPVIEAQNVAPAAAPNSIENIIAQAETTTVSESVSVVENKVIIPEPVVVKAPESLVEQAVAEPKKEEPKTVFSKSATSGMWQVQIMSSPNKKAVEGSQKTMPQKYAPLAGEVLEVETADLKEKGTYYRLNAGAFSSKAEADKLCKDLKALGLSCFTKKKS